MIEQIIKLFDSLQDIEIQYVFKFLMILVYSAKKEIIIQEFK